MGFVVQKNHLRHDISTPMLNTRVSVQRLLHTLTLVLIKKNSSTAVFMIFQGVCFLSYFTNFMYISPCFKGAIELSILSEYYGREIAAYDIQTTRCDLYGQVSIICLLFFVSLESFASS
jgi:hypothetical protein